MNDGILFSELLDYNEEETRRWKQFFAQHPEALDLPLDIAGDVRKLIVHIFAVELYFADLLARNIDKIRDAEDGAPQGTDEFFAIGERAAQRYKEFVAQATPEDWSAKIELGRVGISASKRKLITQAMTHSMRHWAQISTYLRQQGFKQDWKHDFLLSPAME